MEMKPIPRWRLALLRRMVRALFALCTRLEIKGTEHIPVSGGAVLVFNHLSNLDPPLFFALIDRPKLTALLAADYRDRPIHRFFIQAAGGLWIRRGKGDRAALTAAATRLNDGWIVGLAPEGRRSRSHALQAGKPGAAYLASTTGVPVLPVGITGTERIATALRRGRRARVTVTFGEPFTLSPLAPEGHKHELAERTTMLMTRVAALIPPDYRGVYAEPDLTVDLQVEPGGC